MYTDKKFLRGKEASKLLNVHLRTLYNWEEKGYIETIRTAGGTRMYNVDKYLNGEKEEEIKRLKLAYIRVSSVSQKDDLERQREEIKSLYPDHQIIEDIGSGLSLTKRGIKKIIRYAINGEIEELVVLYKDSLTRFGFDHVRELVEEYSGGNIIIVHRKENITPEEELVQDVLQILNVYVDKMNSLKKYNKAKEEKISEEL